MRLRFCDTQFPLLASQSFRRLANAQCDHQLFLADFDRQTYRAQTYLLYFVWLYPNTNDLDLHIESCRIYAILVDLLVSVQNV